ncbi:MAG: hypothetical protein GY773_27100 [Actinomycetia bacterium]|nr:hypothetical protein [Actinomycetes bacterium]
MHIDFKQQLAYIRSEADGFDRHLAALDEPAQAVIGCPGWTVIELRDHTAGVFAFWLSQLAEGDPTANEPTFPPEARTRASEPVAELADEVEVPNELAADGIDELIEVFLDAPPATQVTGTRLLRLVTPDRTWDVAVSENGVWIDSEGASREADTTVRGSASDVILRLWGRPAAAEVSGDSTVLARWQAIMDS